MRLKKVVVQNFRGIEYIELDLDDQLNILIGENGSGKTVILEALTVAVGAFMIGLRDVSTRGIGDDDVRYTVQQEYAYPVIIEANGIIDGQRVSWSRERHSKTGSTNYKNAQPISQIAQTMDDRVRSGEYVDLPLISYFSTGRLFVEAQSRRKKEPTARNGKKELGSRFRGYRESLDAKSSFRRFVDWFELKELSQLQKKETDPSLFMVKQAIRKNLPNCKDVFYDFDPDTNRGLTVALTDGRTLPFEYLSDGVRNFFAMMADIAHRCVLLNPHLQENALAQTEGIVLIDELDLHLHPSWQKSVIRSLTETFPKIQFVVTTHSPFLIQETEANQLIVLEDCKVKQTGSGNNLSLEDIAEELQGFVNPRWSNKREALYEIGKKYYTAVANGSTADNIEEEMTQAEKDFTEDTLFYAYLEALKAMKQ